MKRLLIIFLLFELPLLAQDKLFFRDGSSREGIVLSVSRDKIFFRETENSPTVEIEKGQLILVEKFSGTRYLFPEKTGGKQNIIRAPVSKRNMLGAQPLSLLIGRVTIVYERLSDDGRFGLVLPFTLTFNPSHSFYTTLLDSTSGGKLKKLSFIAGADLNWYAGKENNSGFFIGPRLRYGTDIFLQNMEAFTLQTQIGWLLGAPESIVAQHLAFGFGFAQVFSTVIGPYPYPRHIFGWYSMTYRVSFRW